MPFSLLKVEAQNGMKTELYGMHQSTRQRALRKCGECRMISISTRTPVKTAFISIFLQQM